MLNEAGSQGGTPPAMPGRFEWRWRTFAWTAIGAALALAAVLACVAVWVFAAYMMSVGAGPGPTSQPFVIRALEFVLTVPIPPEPFASQRNAWPMLIVAVLNLCFWSLVAGTALAALVTAITGIRYRRTVV
jgi:hypothetical protein